MFSSRRRLPEFSSRHGHGKGRDSICNAYRVAPRLPESSSTSVSGHHDACRLAFAPGVLGAYGDGAARWPAGGCRERAWRCPCPHGHAQVRQAALRSREGAQARRGSPRRARARGDFCMVFIVRPLGGRQAETHSIMNARQARYEPRHAAAATCEWRACHCWPPLKIVTRTTRAGVSIGSLLACLSRFDWVGSQPGRRAYTAIGVNESLCDLIDRIGPPFWWSL